MLNLVELGRPADRVPRAHEELAALVMAAAGVDDYQLVRTESEVYGEMVDVEVNGAEVCSAGMGPHPLDGNWGIVEPWVGLGFGLERLIMAREGYPNIERAGRSLDVRGRRAAEHLRAAGTTPPSPAGERPQPFTAWTTSFRSVQAAPSGSRTCASSARTRAAAAPVHPVADSQSSIVWRLEKHASARTAEPRGREHRERAPRACSGARGSRRGASPPPGRARRRTACPRRPRAGGSRAPSR